MDDVSRRRILTNLGVEAFRCEQRALLRAQQVYSKRATMGRRNLLTATSGDIVAGNGSNCMGEAAAAADNEGNRREAHAYSNITWL